MSTAVDVARTTRVLWPTDEADLPEDGPQTPLEEDPRTRDESVTPHEDATRPRLVVMLSGDERVEVWDDRIDTPGGTFPFDEWFGMLLVDDPRAPLTLDVPAYGVALRTVGAHWETIVPQDNRDTIRLFLAASEACHERGIAPIGIDEPSNARLLAVLPRMTAATPAIQAMETTHDADLADEDASGAPAVRQGRRGEVTLAVMAHLGWLCLPVLLAALIAWWAERYDAPYVEEQARHAREFQGIGSLIVLPVLAYALAMAAIRGSGPAVIFAFAIVVALMALGGACALNAALHTAHDRTFSYFDCWQRLWDVARFRALREMSRLGKKLW
jgi:uncharacterized Tic20 family protein